MDGFSVIYLIIVFYFTTKIVDSIKLIFMVWEGVVNYESCGFTHKKNRDNYVAGGVDC